MAGDDRTLAFYTAEAAVYAQCAVEDDSVRQLEAFAALVPPGGDILDFGCGAGWAAAWFRDHGFRASGFDGSEGLAAEARARHGLDVTVGRFQDFFAEAAHDGIWASFCLLHDSRAAMPEHLARLYRALRPGGVLYLGLKEGTGERRDRLGRLYTYFTADEMRGLLGEAGFGAPGITRFEAPGYDGPMEPCMHIQVRRG